MKLLASTICAVSMSAMAVSASVVSIDLGLRYEGEIYHEVDLYYDDGTEVFYDTLASQDDMLGLTRMFPHLSVGDEISFSVDIDPDGGPDEFGTTYNCSFDGIDCGGNEFASVTETSFGLDMFNLEVVIEGGRAVGDTVSFYDLYSDDFTDGASEGDDWYTYWWDQEAIFTVVADNTLSELPLPAAAFFMVGGLGLLVSLGRRRKS